MSLDIQLACIKQTTNVHSEPGSNSIFFAYFRENLNFYIGDIYLELKTFQNMFNIICFVRFDEKRDLEKV